jgi:hypothetical protein
MYYNPKQDSLNNPLSSNQELNRDSESSDDVEFTKESCKTSPSNNMEYMNKLNCKCCMYYHPQMGCMYSHKAMQENDDPMQEQQYERQAPMLNGPFYPQPFHTGHFFSHYIPHYIHHHYHHHFYHHQY